MEFELWYEQILNFPQQVAGSIQKVNRESCDSENKFYLYYSPGIGSKEGQSGLPLDIISDFSQNHHSQLQGEFWKTVHSI